MSVLLASCASRTSVDKDKKINETVFHSNDLKQNSEKIDKHDTFDIFFRLESKLDCIKFTLLGTVEKESIAGGETTIPLYYIIERILNSSTKEEYSEIGRNFTSDWESTPSIQICSQDELPLLRFANGSYRIRVTSFRKEPFTVKISADAQSPITFLAQLPKVK